MHIPTYEGIRLKGLEYKRVLFAKYRKKKLINSNFSIISNNCWGGMVYESYNLPKQSPTVGLFFMADDYIRFLSDMKVYLQKDLEFINPKDSKWTDRQELKGDSRFGSYPVARISNGDENIEIFFLHYHSEKEAQEKWARRIERINWNRLIVKFNDQNGCETEHLEKFLDFDYPNKLFFTCKHWDNIKNENVIYIRQPFFYKTITASHEPFGENKHININEYINNL